jgi:hypothetical protein
VDGPLAQDPLCVVALRGTALKKVLPRECLANEIRRPAALQSWVELEKLFHCHTGLHKLRKADREAAVSVGPLAGDAVIGAQVRGHLLSQYASLCSPYTHTEACSDSASANQRPGQSGDPAEVPALQMLRLLRLESAGGGESEAREEGAAEGTQAQLASERDECGGGPAGAIAAVLRRLVAGGCIVSQRTITSKTVSLVGPCDASWLTLRAHALARPRLPPQSSWPERSERGASRRRQSTHVKQPKHLGGTTTTTTTTTTTMATPTLGGIVAMTATSDRSCIECATRTRVDSGVAVHAYSSPG